MVLLQKYNVADVTQEFYMVCTKHFIHNLVLSPDPIVTRNHCTCMIPNPMTIKMTMTTISTTPVVISIMAVQVLNVLLL